MRRRLYVLSLLVTAGLLGGAHAVWGITGTTSSGGRRPPIDRCPRIPDRTMSVGGKAYARAGSDTFGKSAPLGSFASSSADRIVYKGDHGMGWTEYPDGWPSTHSGRAPGYQPSTVQSVHGGVLDYYLHHDSAGHPVGADPSPLPGGRRYQTYGAWSFCERIAPGDRQNLADFHQAPLLWPRNFDDWQRAESDFPEADLDALNFSGHAHYVGAGSQDVFSIQSMNSAFDPTRWHVYSQVWGLGFRSYYIDGKLVGTSTHRIWSGPERWQLQIEPSEKGGGGSGHVYVKWVWIGRGPARQGHRRDRKHRTQ
jgi:hypothetical protein